MKQDTLIGLHLSREVYGACARQATLISYAGGVARIGVSDARFKDTLERGYLAALRLALGDALEREVTAQVMIHKRGAIATRLVAGV